MYHTPNDPHIIKTNHLATTVLISGLKRGDLAAATADALAHGGAGTIIYTGRSQSELQPVVDHINRKYKTVKMIFVTADPGSLASFRKAAHTIKELGVSIDGFVGFPEVMAVPWELTEDGLESHFQRNYLCYFLLLNLLCDIMKPGSRVVLVTSSLRNEAPAPSWDDLGFEVSGSVCVICYMVYAICLLVIDAYLNRMEKITILSMDIRNRCSQSSCLSSLLRRSIADLSLPFPPIQEVSLLVNCVFWVLRSHSLQIPKPTSRHTLHLMRSNPGCSGRKKVCPDSE
jgi:hypothetical protein